MYSYTFPIPLPQQPFILIFFQPITQSLSPDTPNYNTFCIQNYNKQPIHHKNKQSQKIDKIQQMQPCVQNSISNNNICVRIQNNAEYKHRYANNISNSINNHNNNINNINNINNFSNNTNNNNNIHNNIHNNINNNTNNINNIHSNANTNINNGNYYPKLKLKKMDQQFDPSAPDNRVHRKIRQNQNRNVIPNIMHQVMSFLQKRNKSQKLVNKLIVRLQLTGKCTAKRFYFYQNLIKYKLYHYVNVQALAILKQLQQPLCQIYDAQEQRHYNTISRLLIHHFLTHTFTASILTSRRVSSDKKQQHLQSRRKIIQKLYQLFQE